MSIHPNRRPRKNRACRGSAGGVGSRVGRKCRMRDDGLPTTVEIRALRKRLGIHSRELRCGRPKKYEETK